MDHEFPIAYDVFGIPGFHANLSNILMLAVAAVIVLIIGMVSARSIKMKPTGMQNVFEWLIDFIKNIISNTMSWKTGERFFGLGITIFLFILVANLLGVPFMLFTEETHTVWWRSPTADPIITMTFAIMVLFICHYYGIRLRGGKEYVKDFFRPIPFLFPFKVLEEFTNTITLGMRLSVTCMQRKSCLQCLPRQVEPVYWCAWCKCADDCLAGVQLVYRRHSGFCFLNAYHGVSGSQS
nr:FoF1 ATP synthase subunit a [Sinobaca sp. H24]